MEGGIVVVVRVFPGPAVAGQRGQILYFDEGAVSRYSHPDAIRGVLAGEQIVQIDPFHRKAILF